MNAVTPVHMLDAQAAIGFVTHQRTHIEPEVLKKDYPEIAYSRLIPVDTSAPQWAPSVTFFSQDSTGKAKFINGKGDDIPLANILMNKFEQTVNMAGIGYSFSLEEIGAAQQLGMSLSNEGAMAARDAYEQFVDEVALIGNTALGVEGLFNTTGITSVAAGGVWAGRTPDQILADLNGTLSAIWSGSNGIERANTVVLPLTAYADIATRRLSADNNTTILEYVQRANVYSVSTGQPLMIEAHHRLTTDAVIYRRDPQAVKMHMPMPLTFIPPQSRGLQIDVFGMFRFAPTNIRRPGSFRYLTGVAA